MIQWKPIKRFPGYKACSDGRVLSNKGAKPILLKGYTRRGYRVLILRKEGKTVEVPRGELVLEAFKRRRRRRERVGHKDGNPLNCRLDNLFYSLKAVPLNEFRKRRLYNGRD